MNAVTNTLLAHEPLRVAISAAGSALEQMRPTMTWRIGRTNGRPVIRWVMLPAGSSIMIDER
jgi:hypothetical protein